MKLRTSFFNPTVFKKDLTRFAPTWALYTVGLFMVLAVCMDSPHQYRQAQSLVNTISFMAIINLGYGLLNGQLLFGDLFSAKHCNALHAMPLRRECWYVTHIVSGLLFSLAPNLLMTLVAAAILGTGWSVAFWWLLAVMLQYLFCFGLAVLSALCVGNRFAMVLVYGIINFLSMILYWFYYSIYEPLLYGVKCGKDIFTRLCPVWSHAEMGYDLLVINRLTETHLVDTVEFGEGWGCYAVYAAIGAAMLGLALLLYRRRKLESAGDFMAVRPLEPVFLGLYTLSMAAFFQMFANLFEQSEYVFLGLGIIIGFFTGRMLLMRTIRVFQLKGILACILCGVVFAASMVLTALDPLGVTRYVPKAGDVAGVYVTPSQYNYSNSGVLRMEEPAQVEKAVALHQAILTGGRKWDSDTDTMSICVSYVLKNGKTVRRYYPDVFVNSEAGDLAEYFFTRTEYILNGKPEQIIDGLEMVYLSVDYGGTGGQSGNLPADMARDLMRAVAADCDDGNMTQHWAYMGEYKDTVAWLEYSWVDENGAEFYGDVTVYEKAVNTIAFIEETVSPWLEENGY